MSDQKVTEMSSGEIEEECQQWQAHFDTLDGKVDEEQLELARLIMVPSNFGRGQGKVRPVKDYIKYDLVGFFVPEPRCADGELRLICQLTDSEVDEVTKEDSSWDLDWEDLMVPVTDPNDIDARLHNVKMRAASLGIFPE